MIEEPEKNLLKTLFGSFLPEQDPVLQHTLEQLSPGERARIEERSSGWLMRHAPKLATTFAFAVTGGISGLQYAATGRVDYALATIMLGTSAFAYPAIGIFLESGRRTDAEQALRAERQHIVNAAPSAAP